MCDMAVDKRAGRIGEKVGWDRLRQPRGTVTMTSSNVPNRWVSVITAIRGSKLSDASEWME